MKFCPPLCVTMKMILPAVQATWGSNEVALAAVALVLASLGALALYRRLRSAQ